MIRLGLVIRIPLERRLPTEVSGGVGRAGPGVPRRRNGGPMSLAMRVALAGLILAAVTALAALSLTA